jgi:RNA-directed DNA polymerase
MDCINAFPAKEAVQKWLKAGYVDNDTFNETEKGTPQGGVISPLLANIALHGMEDELGAKYWTDRGRYYLARNSVGIVKYADDFVIVCKTKRRSRIHVHETKPVS